MAVKVTRKTAPALGDIRMLGVGDRIILGEGATERRDWPRYAEAIMTAVTRGAEVRWCESA